MRIIYYLLFFFIFSLFFQPSVNLLAQKKQANEENIADKPIEYQNFYSYRINQDTKDTILAIRKPSSLWFGILAGPNFDFSFGDLYSKQTPGAPVSDIINKVVSFHNSAGYGYFIGVMGEFVPSDSEFGYGLKIIAYDKYITNSVSDSIGLFKSQYNFYSNLTYLTFSPFARYTVPKLGGFYIFSGLDVAINTGSKFKQTDDFENSGTITHEYNVTDVDARTRIGFSLGAGYDFFIADFFSEGNRVRISPFIDFKAGSDIITSYNSSWNNIGIKIGAQFKLSHDKITYDTLIYVPHEEAPIYMASIQDEIGVEYPGFVSLGNTPSVELAVSVKPEPEPIDTVIDVASKLPEDTISTPPITTAPESKLNVRYDETFNLTGYKSSTTTSNTKAIEADLDAAVKFLKNNPRAAIRLTGHSDDRGTREQNDARARARANNAARYLQSKGISKGRIYINSRGALSPIAENSTPEGREANRRVEIIIVR